MSLTSRAATALVRRSAQLPALRQSAAVAQRRDAGTDASTSHHGFTSPFHRGRGDTQDSTVIPSFAKYRGGSETTNKVFSYFMVGAMGGVTALGAKDTVQSEHPHNGHWAVRHAAAVVI